MNPFTENLFQGCWHSASTPCRDFINCATSGQRCDGKETAGLSTGNSIGHRAERATGSSQEAAVRAFTRAQRLEGLDVPVILVGMGTCGLANGAQGVHDALVGELQARGIDARVVATGCAGFCAKEVLVDVVLPGRPRLSYGEVAARDIPRGTPLTWEMVH